MKHKIVWWGCTALAIVAMLMPPAAFAQARGGLQDRIGAHDRGDSPGRGGSHERGGSHARHGFRDHDDFRGSLGIWIGPSWDPWWWWGPLVYPGPYFYPSAYPYYGSPPVVTQPPPVYDRQVPVVEEEESYWYYCQDPPGYYPYVRQCPQGWMKVVPKPESAPAPSAQPQAPAPSTEQQAPPASGQRGFLPEEYYWYYCQDPPGYYPYIRDCPKGWTQAAPAPAPIR